VKSMVGSTRYFISNEKVRTLRPAKGILMLVGDYVEDYEVIVPFQALQVVGHIVHAVCAGKKSTLEMTH
jgi:hypothetical protein